MHYAAVNNILQIITNLNQILTLRQQVTFIYEKEFISKAFFVTLNEGEQTK